MRRLLIVFWAWVARFAYRRWCALMPPGKKPVGVPGNRDPKFPCDHYDPRPPGYREIGFGWECEGDGHYLCRECCHWLIWAEREDEAG